MLLFPLGDQALQVLAHLVQCLRCPALRLARFLRHLFPQRVFRLAHGRFRRRDFIGQLVDVRLEKILHIARLMSEAGLPIAHLFGVPCLSLFALLLFLILNPRVLLSVRLGAQLILGLCRALDTVTGFAQRGQMG